MCLHVLQSAHKQCLASHIVEKKIILCSWRVEEMLSLSNCQKCLTACTAPS